MDVLDGSVYVKHVLDHDLVTNSGKVEQTMISRVSVVSTERATREGGGRRNHIVKTIKKKRVRP
jgi:hypothetical protein